MDKDIRDIISDIKDEVELITLHIEDGVNKTAKWYLEMHTNYLKGVINDLERLL